MAAFLALYLTAESTAYLEVCISSLDVEFNCPIPELTLWYASITQGTWVWLADHDLDGNGGQTTIFSGRGILSESAGPVWMIGTGKNINL